MFTKTKVSCYKVLKKNKSNMLQYVLVYGNSAAVFETIASAKRCRAKDIHVL